MRRLALAAAILVGWAGAGGLGAQTYPERPVRIVVPFAAGGGTDAVMRAVADSIAAERHISIVIDNKPGAGTTLGASAVAQAPADGYTLLANTASFLISPRMMANRPYRTDEFVPVALVASSPHVLVVARDVPAKTLAEFATWAKAKPQPATFASFGSGSSSHLGYEILRERLVLGMVHVPYRGAAPAMLDLLAGRVDTMLADLSTVAEHVKTGSVRALAVTGDTRSPSLPDVPTIAEAGASGFKSESWFGLMMRAETDPKIVAFWSAAVQKALASPATKDKLALLGIASIGAGPATFAQFLSDEDAKYGAAIVRSGAKME